MKTGQPLSKGGRSWSSVFGDKMVEIGKKNPKVAGITAAMSGGTGFEKFQRAFPKRFFDVAIAEQHGTTFAAGPFGLDTISITASMLTCVCGVFLLPAKGV